MGTSGFLVPGKSEGKIELFDTTSGEQGKNKPINIAAGQDHNWSYHWVVWKDMNNDGVLEILASCYDTRKGNETGNLWLYEQSWDDGELSWTRSALASGFVANPYLFGHSMAPGKTRLFWPSKEYKDTPTEAGG